MLLLLPLLVSAAASTAASSAVNLGVPRILESLASYARTRPGRNLCLAAQPATTAAAARAAYSSVSEAAACLGASAAPPLEHPLDVLPLLQAARTGERLDAAALQRIGLATNGLARLSAWSALPEARRLAPTLTSTASRTSPPSRLRQQLCGAFGLGERTHVEPPTGPEAGVVGGHQPALSSSFFPLLGKRRAVAAAAQRRLEQAYEALVREETAQARRAGRGAPAAGAVRREGRLVVPVRASEARSRGEFISLSRTGATAFVVPHALRGLSAQAQAAAAAAADAERRYLAALAALAIAHSPAVRSAIEAAADVDACVARARLGAAWRGVVPQVGAAGVVLLHQARHPVLCLELSPEKVTPNDIAFGFVPSHAATCPPGIPDDTGIALAPSSAPSPGTPDDTVFGFVPGHSAASTPGTPDEVALSFPPGLSAASAAVQGLVLTGPNGGGKTVILSTAGLAAHLARLAIPIPCAGARVDYFGSIVSDLGDAQSVADGMSSYAAHVRTCVEALSAAGLAGEGEGAAVGEEGGVAASGRGDAAPVGGAGHIEVGLISLPANLSPPSPTHSLYPCAPGQAALPTVDGSSVLVLLDEPGRGTDSDEGAAVAAAVMESLLESGARVLATTHAPLLKRFALSHPLLGVAAMGRDESTGAPTHRLLLGVVGHSHALDAAGRGGMPVPILRRARELLPGGGEVQTGAEEYVAALRVAVEKADAARRQAEGLRAAAVADRKAAAASAAAAAAELSRASGWLGAQQRRLDGQLNRLRREQERQDGGGKGGALELIGATVAALTLSRRSADDARARALETLGLAPLPADAPLRAGDAVVVLVSGQGAEYTEDGVVARDAPPGAVGVVVSMYGVECEVARGELAVWAAVAAT